MKNTVVWEMTSCSLVEIHRHLIFPSELAGDHDNAVDVCLLANGVVCAVQMDIQLSRFISARCWP
jgi:hypothetical protein